MSRDYHIIQETKTGTRIMGHTRKLKPAVERVSGGIYFGIPQAMRIAEEEEGAGIDAPPHPLSRMGSRYGKLRRLNEWV